MKGSIVFEFSLQLLLTNSLKSVNYILTVIVQLNKAATLLRLLVSLVFMMTLLKGTLPAESVIARLLCNCLVSRKSSCCSIL